MAVPSLGDHYLLLGPEAALGCLDPTLQSHLCYRKCFLKLAWRKSGSSSGWVGSIWKPVNFSLLPPPRPPTSHVLNLNPSFAIRDLESSLMDALLSLGTVVCAALWRLSFLFSA